ncbi:HD family phosphohydrolase [Deltaproteobacteria bacterium]|nr:HD family phosphohydrolase [Deltaproteobacteria bacterium]
MNIPLHELLFSLSHALDFVERELVGITTNHGKRCAYISACICKTLGFSPADTFDMVSCALLHDNALTAYLLKGGYRDMRKLEHIESHCSIGEKNAMAFPFAGNAQGIILHHHENWNGTGYHKLAGEDIPLRACVLRLADLMDRMLRMGDGRSALTDDIRAHSRKFSGKLYAPQVVEALNDILTRDMVRDLADDAIDAALRRVAPPVTMHLCMEKLLEVCSIFALIIDAKSPFTKNHTYGVTKTVERFCGLVGLTEENRKKLIIAGHLHDVGKLSTPAAILEKPDKLTEEEWVVMRTHVSMTEQLLNDITGMEEIALWAVMHHEKLNGTGYPHGRSELPLEGRLIACCDIYQALREDRPYRKGLDFAKTLDIMEDMAVKGEIDGEIVNIIKKKEAPFDSRDAIFPSV